MKNPRITIFSVLLVAAIALATVSILAYAYAGNAAANIYPNATTSGTNVYHSGMMGGDWSGMMGGAWGPSSSVQSPTTTQTAILPLVGLAALVGAAVTGTGGVAYYLTGFKMGIDKHAPKSLVEDCPQNVITPYASVSKILTSEERQVLDVLVLHNGKYLQKYIRAETGLSRLKTHRIVSRLAERGIVTLERRGNTNEVLLSNWLRLETENSHRIGNAH